jgi:hypothetical protein
VEDLAYDYIMRNNRSVRPFTKNIILTHTINLIEDFYIEPDAITHNNFFTAGVMEQYFMHSLSKPLLPYHYYIDNIGEDWYVFKGMREFQPSYFIEDMVQAGVIKYEYLNSILIVLGDDFSRYTVNRRMSEQLASKLLTDLHKRYKLNFDKMLYIDECLNDNWEENLRMSRLKYHYKKGTFYDDAILRSDFNKFKTY